jgi:hypothetical protein
VRIVRETNKPIAQVAGDLGIQPGTLANWVKEDRIERGECEGLTVDERARLNRLGHENAVAALRHGAPVDGPGASSMMTDEFRSYANGLFGFGGTERLASTASGWLTEATAAPLLEYCNRVAAAYSTALEP